MRIRVMINSGNGRTKNKNSNSSITKNRYKKGRHCVNRCPYEIKNFQVQSGPGSRKIHTFRWNSNQLGHVEKLTVESSLQLGTAKLIAYAELTNSEFNKISEIFPIFLFEMVLLICRYDKKNRNSFFKIKGYVSGTDSLLNFMTLFDRSMTSKHFKF